MFAEGVAAFGQARFVPNQDADLFDLFSGEFEGEQFNSRFLAIGRSANDADEFIEIRQGNQITFKRFGALLGFAQFKTRPAKDDFAAMIDVSGIRREVVLRRTRFELRKAEERAETLEGYLIALANLDEFIRIIRGSANRDEARIKLLAFEFTRKQVEQIGVLIRNEARLVEGRYTFSEHQANQILDLRLYQLTGLEREKIDQGIQ